MKIRNFPPRFYTFNAGVKSQLMPILEAGQVLPSSCPTVDSLVIDGASLVNVKQPWQSRTFDNYANHIILPHITSFAQGHFRVDIVFDVYRDESLKGETRRKRGVGYRRKVTDNTRPPTFWNSFLRCNENKTELFGFLPEIIVSATITTEATIFVTKEEKVVSNRALDTEFVSPCNHGEADTRMFLHANMQPWINQHSEFRYRRCCYWCGCFGRFKCGCVMGDIWKGQRFAMDTNPWYCKITGSKIKSIAFLSCIYGLWYNVNVCWER